jgi:flagellar assembly protein FliH
MSAERNPSAGVLRGAATHVQPRRLARPRPVDAAAPVDVAPPTLVPGYEQGFEVGRQAGFEQGLLDAQRQIGEAVAHKRAELEQAVEARLSEVEAEAAKRLERLDNVLSGLEGALVKRLAEVEADAVALAFAAVCKLIGDQAGQAEAVGRILRQGFEALRGAPLLAVRMNEADLRVLQSHPQWRQTLANTPQVRWIADAAVAMGGCLFETPSGTLDARLDTQLDALRSKWLGVVAGMRMTG